MGNGATTASATPIRQDGGYVCCGTATGYFRSAGKRWLGARFGNTPQNVVLPKGFSRRFVCFLD